MKGSKLTIIVSLLTLLMAAPALAQPRPPRPPRRPLGPPAGPPGRPPLAGPMLAKVAQAVGLTAAQVRQIKKISYTTQRRAIAVHSRLAVARLDLQQAMEADKAPSEAQVSAMIGKVGQLETELKKNHLLRVLRIRKTMSLTQWRKLELLHAERKMKR